MSAIKDLEFFGWFWKPLKWALGRTDVALRPLGHSELCGRISGLSGPRRGVTLDP